MAASREEVSERVKEVLTEQLGIDELPPERLAQVFTHPSWAAERSESYERLEFLGDSVLELAIARALFEEYPDFSEGQLARLRAHIVSRQSCAVVGRELGLGRRLSRHAGETSEEELAKLARDPNVLGALLEAALAALVEGKQLGVGRGRSKKDAEQSAAEEALTALSAER